MPTNVTWNGVTYPIPNAGELNWASLTNFLVALGNNAAVAEEAKQTIRVALTTPVTVVAATDYAVVVDLTSPGASVVNLPAGVDKQIFIIVDGKGDALTNNITVNPNGADTLGGMASIVMNRNRQVLMMQYHALTTDWKLTNFSIPIGGVQSTDISGVVAPSKGGTGVANNDAATLTRVGNFDVALTASGATALTLPTTGTLATLAGSETLSSKTLASPLVTGSETLLAQAESRYSDADDSNYVGFKSPAVVPGNQIWELPDADGASGDVLSTDGAGVLSFVAGATSVPATPSTPGIVSITAQSFGGLKTFVDGLSSAEYVGTDPEVGGSSPFTLDATHERVQEINPAGPITIILDGTDLLAGESFKFVNRSLFRITIQAQDASQIDVLDNGSMTLRALIDAPGVSTDWNVDDVNSTTTFSAANSGSSANLTGLSDGQHFYHRMGKVVTVHGYDIFTTVGGGPTFFNLAFPVPLTYTTANIGDAIGSGWASDTASGPGYLIHIFSDTGNQKALISWDNSGNQTSQTLSFTFSYIQRQ